MSSTNLTKAFRALRKAGYFARQNFMCCLSCALNAIPNTKCVFYHKQDVAMMREEGAVFLAWRGNGREIAKILRDHNLSVAWDGTDDERILVLVNPRYPLHLACNAGDTELANQLLDQGADPNRIDRFGAVPLHYCKTAPIAKLIMDAGAKVELETDWISPLHVAVQQNAMDVVRLLVEAGADIDRKAGGTGDSPLDCSRGVERSEIHGYLVSVLEARQLRASAPQAKVGSRLVRF